MRYSYIYYHLNVVGTIKHPNIYRGIMNRTKCVCHFLFLFFYFCSINDKTNWVFDLFTNDEQFDNFIVYPLAMLLQVFINTELYARVSVAVLFDHLWKQIEVKSTLETEEALRSGKLFLLKLLDSAVQPFSL